MDDKIVEFEKYCQTCKYKETAEEDDPCRDCLCIVAKTDNRRPEFWRPSEDSK